ncbi:uroporphyrinogen-III C-methyltransferase [Halomicrococcus sp. SG-WS-1]|uniref:uroporphyrinogen-III C-methyltransferase n=1 Tax=Halomicrococcus sp. SG-WS-1 TaxID=3439057 RepID=UPI003F78BBAE
MYQGTVYLVGAGPGDPELLTVKAARVLETADVVLHDALVGDDVVDRYADATERIDVGKDPNGERTTQEEINRLMVRKAREGNDVVRLKGGDPTVFGRGGEEAEHLAREGIPFEVVPGVTSAIAAPEVAGIPVTHREHASSLTVVTGHEDPTKDESAIDWSALADCVVAGGTLVVLMGVGRMADNARALREHGVPAETPAAVVEQATCDEEFTVTGTVGTIAERSGEVGVEPPAATVFGDVVGVRDQVVDCLEGATAARAGPWNATASDRGSE